MQPHNSIYIWRLKKKEQQLSKKEGYTQREDAEAFYKGAKKIFLIWTSRSTSPSFSSSSSSAQISSSSSSISSPSLTSWTNVYSRLYFSRRWSLACAGSWSAASEITNLKCACIYIYTNYMHKYRVCEEETGAQRSCEGDDGGVGDSK